MNLSRGMHIRSTADILLGNCYIRNADMNKLGIIGRWIYI